MPDNDTGQSVLLGMPCSVCGQQGLHNCVAPYSHPRCDCHQCTQARVPSWERQFPVYFFDPAKTDVKPIVQQAVAAECARCAKIAADVGYRLYAEGRGEETMGPVREIAEKIQSGE